MTREGPSVGWNKRRRYDEAAALANEIHYGCRFGTRGTETSAGSRRRHANISAICVCS